MNAVVLCVGRLKEPWQRAGVEEYLKRLSRYGKYSVEQVDDAPDSLGARALEKEGDALLKRIRPGDHVVALCVEAEAPDSPGLAQCLRRWAALGSRTVLSGSVSRGKNDPSQSLQMMERPLMTPDELKSMPKGSFIVAKTGVHPMKVKLRLFLDWGIRFGMPYEVPEKAQRFVAYADKQELEESIIRRHYGTIVMDSEQPQGGGTSAGGMAQGIQAAPDSRKTVFRP